MPTENELRAAFRSAEAPLSTIEVAAIIRRSKRRRLPAQIGVGSATTLAVAGIGFAGFSGIQPPGLFTSSAGIAESTSDSPVDAASGHGLFTDASSRAPADKLNLCGGTVAEVAPSSTGLQLTTHFPLTAPATGEPVSGTVTLTNTSSDSVSGTTAAVPAITVSQGGVTLWHSNGPMIMLAVEVKLAAGESMDYQASVTPVRCDVEDDLAEGFRSDLPALEPGAYDLSAAIELVTGSGANELITGPRSTITLR